VTEFALKILSMEFYKDSLKLLGRQGHLISDFTIQKIDLMRFVFVVRLGPLSPVEQILSPRFAQITKLRSWS